MNSTKQQRVDTVNKIIKEISSRGRRFFYHNGNIAKMILKNNRVYMVSEWHGKEMPMQTKYGMQPKGWHNGGTLWGLSLDFTDFINHGGLTNHNNGYGGLYCSHWGYPREDMESIRSLAKSLGYLKGGR